MLVVVFIIPPLPYCRLKIFVPIAFLAWAVLVPVNYTDDNLSIAKVTANVTASDIDKLSISNIPAKSQRFQRLLSLNGYNGIFFLITLHGPDACFMVLLH